MGINRLSHGRIEAGAGLSLGWLPYQPLGRLLGLFPGLLLGLFLGLAAPVAAQQLERVSQSLQNPWGMSFIDAGAVLVTERGGPLSHPATLAREYGLPAVLSVPNATSVVDDGLRVTVDGGAGTVELP